MRFYRPLNTINAITFDLDDTLYDNGPTMVKAESEFLIALQQIDGLLGEVTLNAFNQIKQQVLYNQPEIYHDVIKWRIAAIKQFLSFNGIEVSRISAITDSLMDNFFYWRQQITVPQCSLDLLDKLAAQYPLVAITNGNADINQIGLGHYFQFSLRGGVDGRAKPFVEIFNFAAEQLELDCRDILHVGDNLHADVQGAINSDMQACWLNIMECDIYQQSDARVLPHIEITKLSELNNLL